MDQASARTRGAGGADPSHLIIVVVVFGGGGSCRRAGGAGGATPSHLLVVVITRGHCWSFAGEGEGAAAFVVDHATRRPTVVRPAEADPPTTELLGPPATPAEEPRGAAGRAHRQDVTGNGQRGEYETE